jgi:hypothetical protein
VKGERSGLQTHIATTEKAIYRAWAGYRRILVNANHGIM